MLKAFISRVALGLLCICLYEDWVGIKRHGLLAAKPLLFMARQSSTMFFLKSY